MHDKTGLAPCSAMLVVIVSGAKVETYIQAHEVLGGGQKARRNAKAGETREGRIEKSARLRRRDPTNQHVHLMTNSLGTMAFP
jgi:hypothetical protein